MGYCALLYVNVCFLLFCHLLMLLLMLLQSVLYIWPDSYAGWSGGRSARFVPGSEAPSDISTCRSARMRCRAAAEHTLPPGRSLNF